MLDIELESVTSKEYDPGNVRLRGNSYQNMSAKAAAASRRPSPKPLEETNFLAKIMAGRNQLYMQPFDTFDPQRPLRGKKKFDESFRPVRSKINIKISAPEVVSRKRVNKITVE